MSSAHESVCNCLAVRQAARQLTQLYDAELAPTGLRATQFSVLALLSQLQPATVQELADALVMDRTTVTHNLKPLERDGLVSIGTDEADQRARRLRLTVAGMARFKEAREAWKRAQQKFERAFGAREAAALRRELARAIDAAG